MNKYLLDNQGIGYLNIRCSSANGAVPISNVKIKISKIIDGREEVFYEGVSDSSGSISNIELPTPIISDVDEPKYSEYDILATYNDINLTFKIRMYSYIKVLQNINIVPMMESI